MEETKSGHVRFKGIKSHLFRLYNQTNFELFVALNNLADYNLKQTHSLTPSRILLFPTLVAWLATQFVSRPNNVASSVSSG